MNPPLKITITIECDVSTRKIRDMPDLLRDAHVFGLETFAAPVRVVLDWKEATPTKKRASSERK